LNIQIFKKTKFYLNLLEFLSKEMILIRSDLRIPIIDPLSWICPQKSCCVQSTHWAIIQTITIDFWDSNFRVIKFMISGVRIPNSLIVNYFWAKRWPLIDSGSPILNWRALDLLNHFLSASSCFVKSLFLNRLSSAA